MKINVHRHLLYYVVLITVLFLGFWVARQTQWIFIVLPLVYSLLGILHQGIEHTLTPKIMVEYTLIASIGMVIMLFLASQGV